MVGASESVHRRHSCLATETGTVAFFLTIEVPQFQFIDSVEDTLVWQKRQVPWRFSPGGASVSSWTSPFPSFSNAQSSRLLTGARAESYDQIVDVPTPQIQERSSDRSSILQCPRLASVGLAYRHAPPCRECFAEVHGVVSSTVVDLVLLPPWYRQSLSVLHAAQTSVLLSLRDQSTVHPRRLHVPGLL